MSLGDRLLECGVSDWRRRPFGHGAIRNRAGFAEILRESPYVSGYTLSDVAREAWELARAFEGRPDVDEFRQLAEIAARISGH